MLRAQGLARPGRIVQGAQMTDATSPGLQRRVHDFVLRAVGFDAKKLVLVAGLDTVNEWQLASSLSSAELASEIIHAGEDYAEELDARADCRLRSYDAAGKELPALGFRVSPPMRSRAVSTDGKLADNLIGWLMKRDEAKDKLLNGAEERLAATYEKIVGVMDKALDKAHLEIRLLHEALREQSEIDATAAIESAEDDEIKGQLVDVGGKILRMFAPDEAKAPPEEIEADEERAG